MSDVPMVERCAQAIRADGHVFADEYNYTRIARAVLEAARHPTLRMNLAGAPKITAQMPRFGARADYDAAHDAWVAMMDSALATPATSA